MLYKCYLRKGIVYVPTVGRRGGAYTDIEPVAAIPVTDAAGLRRAFLDVIGRGNVAVPPIKGKWPAPVVQKHAGAKSWAEFARQTLPWNIAENGGLYQISGSAMQPDGYWVQDKNQKIEFLPGTPVDDVIDRMIAILQEEARKNAPLPKVSPERPPRPPLPLLNVDDDWVRLLRGPERIDELADFIEWMANAKPEDEQTIRAEIKRYFHDVGDRGSAAALNSAFTVLLRPDLTRADRQSMLDQLDVYTRTDPRDHRN